MTTSVRDNNGFKKIQSDQDRLLRWEGKWQMNINVKRCKVLYVGYSNKISNQNENVYWFESVD